MVGVGTPEVAFIFFFTFIYVSMFCAAYFHSSSSSPLEERKTRGSRLQRQRGEARQGEQGQRSVGPAWIVGAQSLRREAGMYSMPEWRRRRPQEAKCDVTCRQLTANVLPFPSLPVTSLQHPSCSRTSSSAIHMHLLIDVYGQGSVAAVG